MSKRSRTKSKQQPGTHAAAPRTHEAPKKLEAPAAAVASPHAADDDVFNCIHHRLGRVGQGQHR